MRLPRMTTRRLSAVVVLVAMEAEVRDVLAEHGLAGVLEVGKTGVAYYNPDNDEYRTQSEPK